MKKLLLVRRLQTDKQWEEDCYNIASKVVEEINHNFPYTHYQEIFKESLARYIAEFEIYLSNPIDLLEVYETVFKEGYDYSYLNFRDDNYFKFDLTDDLEDQLNTLILKHITLYYNTYKTDLIAKLDSLDNDVIFIYPRQFYRNILKLFYTHNNPCFKSEYNNDEDCINEITDKWKKDDYQIINI